jgi:hypothetical protein
MQTRRRLSVFLALAVLACLVQTPSVRAQGFVITENVSIPLELTTFVPCANGGAGENVDLSGNLHVLFHLTASDSGRVTIKDHAQPQGITGVGQVTGDLYRGTGVSQQTQTFFADLDFPFVVTFVDNFRIIGPGPGNNLLMHETFHITLNPNGVFTAEVDNITVDCK